MNMVRKQFMIDAERSERLKRLAQQQGVSEAEVIRQAIDQRLATAPASDDEWRTSFRNSMSQLGC